MAAITRFQGDTVPDNIAVKNSDNSAYDVTGCSFIMTVASKVKGVVTTMFTINGVITNPTEGLVGFSPTVPQAGTAIGSYFFTIRMTNTLGQVQTILADAYSIVLF